MRLVFGCALLAVAIVWLLVDGQDRQDELGGPRPGGLVSQPESIVNLPDESTSQPATRGGRRSRVAVVGPTEGLGKSDSSDDAIDVRRTVLLQSVEKLSSMRNVFLRSDQLAMPGTTPRGVSAHRLSWKPAAEELFAIEAEIPLVLSGAGRVELFLPEETWMQSIYASEQSPDPIVLEIGRAIPRRLIILANQGVVGADEANVRVRPMGTPVASVLGVDVRFDASREGWIVECRSDRMEVDVHLKRDGTLLDPGWKAVSWANGRQTQTLDLRWEAELEVALVEEDGSPASLSRGQLVVRGPAGGPVSSRVSRHGSLVDFGLQTAGLHSITLESAHLELVGGEQWVEVPAGERARIDLVVRDLLEPD